MIELFFEIIDTLQGFITKSKKSIQLKASNQNKVVNETKTTELQSQDINEMITTIKSIFPDYGKAFIITCLQVFLILNKFL